MQKTLNETLSEIEKHLKPAQNLANLFHELNLFARTHRRNLPSIIHSVLIQNRSCACLSFNLSQSVPRSQELYDNMNSKSGFDTVVAYHQSEWDIFLINPLEWQHWKVAGQLIPDSLMVVYTRSVPSRNRDREMDFLKRFRSICDSRVSSETASAALGPPSLTELTPQQVTPRYAVPVTNEFFHYGNVEAWQNIIESYQKKHDDLKVHIFHRDKPIYQIRSLFKWGKVCVGDVIHFSVSGSEFKDMAKLKKYLTIGASSRFMPFIKKNVNSSLELF